MPAEQARLLLMAGLDMLIGLADVVFLLILVLIINAYTGNAVTGALSVYNTLLHSADAVTVTGVFFVLFCIKNLLGIWLAKSQHHFVYDVASRLSRRNLLAYLKGGYLKFINVDSSVQVRHISQVPIEFSHYVLTNLQQMMAQSILIACTIGAILLFHPTLFILLMLLLLPPVLLLGTYIKNRLKKIRTQIKESSVKVIQYLQESLLGYVESNIYSKTDFFTTRYYHHQQRLNQNIATQQTLQGLSARFVEIFALLGFFILMVVNRTLSGRFTVDVLTIGIFMAAAYKIIPGVVKIMNSSGQIKTYSFTLNELADVDKAYQHLVPDTESVVKQLATIEFNEVSFKFKENSVIDGLSFAIRPGDIAGISGFSGRGKTTLVNLLLGFLEQDSGTIAINGQAVNAMQRAKFWQGIAYVKQQGFFINDSILKNITLTDEIHNEDRLNYAISVSGLDIFLEKYPEGIEKIIHEHGKNISGGQRQRLALARALYHDFELLILDEPFSEMDEAAECEILERLQAVGKSGRMLLFITHNKTSLAYCNKIILADAA
jgi:ABC-type bacteriocin/lantibiotic exporter with double-glycine peptidase domain